MGRGNNMRCIIQKERRSRPKLRQTSKAPCVTTSDLPYVSRPRSRSKIPFYASHENSGRNIPVAWLWRRDRAAKACRYYYECRAREPCGLEPLSHLSSSLTPSPSCSHASVGCLPRDRPHAAEGLLLPGWLIRGEPVIPTAAIPSDCIFRVGILSFLLDHRPRYILLAHCASIHRRAGLFV